VGRGSCQQRGGGGGALLFGSRWLTLARLTGLRRDQWQCCCCIVHLLSPCTPAVPPWLPSVQTVKLELVFAGNMSANLLHLPVCNTSDVPNARSCLQIPRQCSTQTSQYHSPLQNHCGRLHWQSHGHSPLSTQLQLTQAQHHPTHHSPYMLGEGGIRALAAMAQGSALPHGAVHGCETLNAPGNRAIFQAF
jgi:hypothetical protein